MTGRGRSSRPVFLLVYWFHMADDSRPDEKSFIDGRVQDYLVCATKRVLIVDDEPLVVAVLRDFFAALQQGEFFASFQQGRAYEVTTALAPASALDILRRERFDLILLDTSMPGRWQAPRFRPSRWPGRQGLELLRRVRGLGVTAPVLMMTAVVSANEAWTAEALIAGAVGYLYKPFLLEELDRAVVLALGSSPQRDDSKP